MFFLYFLYFLFFYNPKQIRWTKIIWVIFISFHVWIVLHNLRINSLYLTSQLRYLIVHWVTMIKTAPELFLFFQVWSFLYSLIMPFIKVTLMQRSTPNKARFCLIYWFVQSESNVHQIHDTFISSVGKQRSPNPWHIHFFKQCSYIYFYSDLFSSVLSV